VIDRPFYLVEKRGSLSQKRPLFREVNERIRQVNVPLGPESRSNEILLCECGRSDCSVRLEVPAEVYDVVRSEGHRYLVAPGHEEPEREEVVAGAPSYLVVAMRPEPA
jgi:hypothetical protein